MKIQRLIDSSSFHASEAEIREWYKYGVVGVYYTSLGYGDTVKYVEELMAEVLKEYPKVNKSDVRIWTIGEKESNMHAHFMTLIVPVPIDDYLRLRAEGKINIK